MIFQILSIIILLIFYTVYVGKIVMQNKKGIKTDKLGKGDKPRNVLMIEIVTKISTYCVIPCQLYSIFFDVTLLSTSIRVIAFIISVIGIAIFILSVWTMRDNWRAGISENEKTEMVTTGVYSVSRNPAFVGFDLMYIGLLLMFFNFFLVVSTIFAISMLHFQILQEEKFLLKLFGEQYMEYKKTVNRYLGRRKLAKLLHHY